MKSSMSLSLLLILLFAGLAAPAASAQTRLRWRFTSGETLHYRVTTRTVNSAPGTSTNSLATTLCVDVRYAVDSADSAGTAKLTQTIDRVRIRIESPQGEASQYDTAAGQEPAGMVKWMAPMFHAVLGKPVGLRMDARGKISDVKLPGDLSQRVEKAVGGDQLVHFFSAEGISHVLGAVILPEQPAQSGTRWPHSVTLANPTLGQQTVESVYVYEGSVPRGAHTAEKITSTVEMTFAPGPEQPFHVTARHQKTGGTAYFDSLSGRLLESESHSTMKLQVAIAHKKLDPEMKSSTLFGGKTFSQDVEIVKQVQLLDPGQLAAGN